MRQTFTKLIASLVILVNSQIVFAKKAPNYPEGFTPKTTSGVIFTENKGQVCDQSYKPRPDVLFGAMAGNMAFHLKTNGISYQLYRVDKYKEVFDERTQEKRKEIDQQTIYRVDLNWVNFNKNFTKTTHQTLQGCNNYYLESCPNGVLNVKSYTGVTLHNLYNGINLHYYEKNGQLKHDYIVAPNSDYKQIQLKVEGARISINKDGSILLITPLGKIQEGPPIVYQNDKKLKARWIVTNNLLSFEIENYNVSQELIIDPITRLWGTYYGGSTNEYGNSCATDATGNVYLAGFCGSSTSTAIATTGAHQTVYGGGFNDAFLVEFNSSGVRQWATYYGGVGDEGETSCATDATGNVYLAGITTSNTSTVIATAGAHQTVYGGATDAFLAKFNSNGVRQWATYYGGNGQDQAEYCATDAMGNIYLAGFTDSNTGTVIATAGAHQAISGGVGDAFLVKFNSNGVRQWATYYGGSGFDQGYSCATDATDNVYLVGHTSSSLAIATSGVHQTVLAGGDDVFLVKFDPNGVRQWGTYYGGSATDRGHSCTTDATGNVYVAGYTDSNTGTVIATAGAHQSVSGGNVDAFLVQFNSSGIRQWGTYYGGAGYDYANPCSTDAIGNVYLPGRTDANIGTIIATAGAHQSMIGGGYDAFLIKFNSTGVRQWGTYYGGLGTDLGISSATDAAGNVYLAGRTSSGGTGTVIATTGAHQSTFGGVTIDAFLVKFTDCVTFPTVTAVSSSTNGICVGESATLTASGANTFTWNTMSTSTVITISPNVTTSYTVTGADANGCQNTAVVTQSVDACTGINQITNSSNQLIVFPNPFNSKITIVSNGSKQTVQVYNALGSVVYNTIIENEKTEIDLTQQASGIYFIRIGLLTKKLIKE